MSKVELQVGQVWHIAMGVCTISQVNPDEDGMAAVIWDGESRERVGRRLVHHSHFSGNGAVLLSGPGSTAPMAPVVTVLYKGTPGTPEKPALYHVHHYSPETGVVGKSYIHREPVPLGVAQRAHSALPFPGSAIIKKAKDAEPAQPGTPGVVQIILSTELAEEVRCALGNLPAGPTFELYSALGVALYQAKHGE